jgi:hypothetical protein
MAMTERRKAPPKVPRLDEIDANRIWLDYDLLSDSLLVSLVGEPRPAYNEYVDDDTMFRIDPETNEVVGLEFEHFLRRALSLPAGTDGGDS